KWKTTRARRASRTCADGLLGICIAAVTDEEGGLYSAKRITASLNEDEHYARANHKKIARIMKTLSYVSLAQRRRCVTTRRSTVTTVFAALVRRRFHADSTNQVRADDFTYLLCRNGFNMYLATVIDLHSRKLAGFAIADHKRTSLVIET